MGLGMGLGMGRAWAWATTALGIGPLCRPLCIGPPSRRNVVADFFGHGPKADWPQQWPECNEGGLASSIDLNKNGHQHAVLCLSVSLPCVLYVYLS